jgi:2-haloacid dehalogenase/putative hydrolase of the HAD superfamily
VQLDGVFLDMYGTLTTGDRAAVEAVCRQIVADTRLPLSPDELAIIWGERFFHAMDFANGEQFVTLLELEARTLCTTLDAYSLRVDPYPYVARLADYWQDPPLQPEVLDFLAAFPRPICIVSNADRVDIERALARHNICVAGLVTSQDTRSYKPHPGIFETALALTGWRRERVIHVGDSLHSDVSGASAVGLRTGWVNRAHRIHDIGNHQPDHEFEDLHGLAALVAGGSCPPGAG